MFKKQVHERKTLATKGRSVGSSMGGKLFLVVCFLFAALVSPALAQDKVGIAPFTVFGPPDIQYMKDALPQMLFSRLPSDAKEIVGKQALAGLENKDELAQARKIMDAADYEYLVLGTYTKMGEAFSIDVKVLKKGATDFKAIYVSMDRESKIFSAVQDLSKQVAAVIGAPASPAPAARVETPAPKELPAAPVAKARTAAEVKDAREAQKPFPRLKVTEVHFPPTAGVCLGDIDGDGKNELVTGGNNTIYVYRVDDIRLTLLSSFILKGYEILSLNCGDFDKNGRDEVYATTLRADDAVTVVLEGTTTGQLQRQLEAYWYVRVINHPVEGNLLVGQRMGDDRAFAGDIYRLAYSKTGLTAKAPLEFKGQLNLYQIQPIKYRGRNGMAFFDDSDLLKMMDDSGKVLERLKERYGGSMWSVQKGMNTLMEKNYFPLYQRLVRIEDGDTDALLVVKNEGSRLFSRYRSFDRGQVAYLKFDETNYREAALSEMIDGYLSDVAMDKEGEKIYVTVVSENRGGKIFLFNNRQGAP